MISLSELERLAERAVGCYGDLEEDVADARADFIAAANPETVKLLCRIIRRLAGPDTVSVSDGNGIRIELGPESKPPTETTSGRIGPR